MEITANEDVKLAIVEYLKTFESGLKKAGDFSMEQVPLVIQEFLAWQFWGSVTACCGCCLAILIISMIHKYVSKRVSSGSDAMVLNHLLCGVGVVIATPGVIISFVSALKVSVAPRLVILEKISELL